MDSGHVNARNDRPLYRSRNDRMIAGVCGGLAERYGWDPTLVRLAAVAAALVSGGGIFIAYIVAAIVIPEEPEGGFQTGDRWYSSSWSNQRTAPRPPAAPEQSQPEPPSAEEAPTAPITPATPAPPEAPSGPPSAAQQWAGTPSAYPPRIPRRSRNGGLVVGAILVALGIVLLFGRFFAITFAMLWPLILVAIGLLVMFGGGRGGDWR